MSDTRLAFLRRLRWRVVDIRRRSEGIDWFRADAIQLKLREKIREEKRP